MSYNKWRGENRFQSGRLTSPKSPPSPPFNNFLITRCWCDVFLKVNSSWICTFAESEFRFQTSRGRGKEELSRRDDPASNFARTAALGSVNNDYARLQDAGKPDLPNASSLTAFWNPADDWLSRTTPFPAQYSDPSLYSWHCITGLAKSADGNFSARRCCWIAGLFTDKPTELGFTEKQTTNTSKWNGRTVMSNYC